MKDSSDALRALHLQAGAPHGLVADVYEYLIRKLESPTEETEAAVAEQAALHATYEAALGSTDISAPEPQEPPGVCADADRARDRSPFDLLFVRPDAPADIVDVAYRYWRRSSASLRVEAEEPFDSADDRIAGLGRQRPVDVVNGTDGPSASPADAWVVAESGKRYAVGDQPLRIGRDPMCDIVTPLNGVCSSGEARVWSHKGRHLLHGIAGNGGANGSGAVDAVLVNGDSVSWAVLDNGDQLEIGGLTFRFETGDGRPETSGATT